MKKKKARKIKFKSFIVLFLIIGLILGFVFLYRSINVKNIYVSGNNLISEQEVLDLVGLSNYPKLHEVTINDMKTKLLEKEYIKKVNVSKSLLGKVEIEIEEHRLLFKDINSDNYILENGKQILLNEDYLGIPLLTNQVLEEKSDKFIKSFLKINTNIFSKISEITYSPTDLDDERFLLYMNDGINVYVNLNKIDNLNSYNDIVPTLEGKKGILYLDSGNHFEIKK